MQSSLLSGPPFPALLQHICLPVPTDLPVANAPVSETAHWCPFVSSLSHRTRCLHNSCFLIAAMALLEQVSFRLFRFPSQWQAAPFSGFSRLKSRGPASLRWDNLPGVAAVGSLPVLLLWKWATVHGGSAQISLTCAFFFFQACILTVLRMSRSVVYKMTSEILPGCPKHSIFIYVIRNSFKKKKQLSIVFVRYKGSVSNYNWLCFVLSWVSSRLSRVMCRKAG